MELLYKHLRFCDRFLFKIFSGLNLRGWHNEILDWMPEIWVPCRHS
jgi:hypothetical protein